MNSNKTQTKNSFWAAPSSEGLLISDLSICQPRSAIAEGPSQRDWYSIPYATRNGIQGVMLGKGELARPDDVRLRLHPKGWHAIYLGLYRGGAEPDRPFNDPFLIRVKLSGDPLFDSVRPSVSDQAAPNRAVARYASAIEEFFWKAADLEAHDLIISASTRATHTAAQLAFVRLVPMTDIQIEEYRRTDATRNLAVQVDGASGSLRHGSRTVEDLIEGFEPLRNTDVGKVFLGVAGVGPGLTYHPTEVGREYATAATEFLSESSRRTVESLRRYRSRGIDLVRERVDFLHSLGIEVFLGFRMGTTGDHPPGHARTLPFWKEHPEWRCRDRDGNSIIRLSMAYPEVRRFYVKLFVELAAYGIEGVQLIYTRRPPFVLFEDPVIEDFRNEYGVDPRQLPEDSALGGEFMTEGGFFTSDPRLETHWAGYVTAFMRELRQALDERRQPDVGRIQIAANVLYNAAYNRAGGLDLETWVAEGLVDILVPPTQAYDYAEERHIPVIDYEYFNELTAGSACVFYPDLFPRQMCGGEYVRQARQAYEGGASGLAFWDSDVRVTMKSQWNTTRRLGGRDDLSRIAREHGGYVMHELQLIEDWNPSTIFM